MAVRAPGRSRDGGNTEQIVPELEMRQYRGDGPPEREFFSGREEAEVLLSAAYN